MTITFEITFGPLFVCLFVCPLVLTAKTSHLLQTSRSYVPHFPYPSNDYVHNDLELGGRGQAKS